MAQAGTRFGTGHIRAFSAGQKHPQRQGLFVKRFPTGFFATVLTLSVSLTAVPTEAGVSIIRDAETEQLLRDYVTPIFHAAGINTGAARIILIGDKGFNAFVADGQKIFINVGALMDAKTPNEVIGVLAH